MQYVGTLTLVDENGQPFPERIEGALRNVMPRLLRCFPDLRDEVVVAEILEEAGRRIIRREIEVSPIEHLHGYAWVTARSIAVTKMRRSGMRIARATLDGEDSSAALNVLHSDFGSPERIESGIHYRETLQGLSTADRLLLIQKRFGFSSREIARDVGTTVAQVNTAFFRLKQKLLAARRGQESAAPTAVPVEPRRRARTA